MARNEDRYIGDVLDHLWTQGVDRIVVEDGTSTDLTVDVCREHGVDVVPEPDRVYDQPARMCRLTDEWCSPGDWVIPFDADEFWYAHEGTLRHALTETTATKAWARMFEHADWRHRRPEPKPLPKVAWKHPGTPAFGNHAVTRRGDDAWILDIREWQYRSWEHFLEKVEKQRELLVHTPGLEGQYGTHKNRLVHMTADELAAEWARIREGEWVVDPIPSLSSRP